MDVLKFGAISKTCGHQFVLYKDNENRSKPIFFFWIVVRNLFYSSVERLN